MFQRRRKMGVAGVAALAATALLAAGCGSSGSGSSSSGGGTPIKGGTATVALPAGVTYNWIFPFYAITNASVYNDEQFQFLMYRPLYMFGNNTNDSVAINYPLSPADAPVYSNGGKTVTITMKGWKWSNGETVDANDLIFYLNMTIAEKSIWYAYAPGLLPDNIVSYKATGPNTVVINLNQAYSSIWFTYNQLAELNPMPMAWDISSAGGAAGSGGCTTDTAADGWAKCQAVYNYLTNDAKNAAGYATDPLWSVVDGPWKLSSFNTDGNVTMVPNSSYSGPVKPQISELKFVPFTTTTAEYTALKTGSVNVGFIPSEDLPSRVGNNILPSTDPLGTNFTLEPFYSFGITYAQPNFNNPQVGYLVRQLYIRQALQDVFDQPGIIKAIFKGYGIPTSGPAPNQPPGNQWEPSIQQENGQQGPYPFSTSAAAKLLTDHGWSMVGGTMQCQDPSKCGAGITKGEPLSLTYTYSTGSQAVTEMWQTYKSDASKAGIDITLVGQSFDTIIGEAAPCTPMGPKCNVQVFAYGGWGFDGPGFEPTGEPLFQTGAGSNSGNYSDPTMDKLINETHTSSSMAVFDQYATYGAQQLPYIWAPQNYAIQAVSNNLHNVTFNALYTLLPEYWYFTK